MLESPPASAVAEAAERSPLRAGPAFTELADDDELRYRDEIELELQGEPAEGVPRFIEGKELVARLEHSLAAAGIAPAGTVADLGAGSCWLGAVLARRPEVERVIAVEFSRRRLEDLAPVAIAYLGAPPEKIERVVADFHAPGIEPGSCDLVTLDSAFHHSADPERLTRVAFDLLRPGGTLLLFREPTLALLRPTRDHGVEDDHGSFEHEYWSRGYLRMLRDAGFEARKVPSTSSFRRRRTRAILRPPLKWLNGIAYAEFTYVGVRPASRGT